MGEVLVVFTAKVTEIEASGGTAHWALSPRSMKDCEYVVCTRNSNPAAVEDFGEQSSIPHGSAFLVGKVIGIEKTKVENGRQRYRVMMDQVADVLSPAFWDGSRVPTRYFTKAEVKALGIDLDALPFRPVARIEPARAGKVTINGAKEGLPGLSIADAKAGLAARFGVSAEEIDIVIRG